MPVTLKMKLRYLLRGSLPWNLVMETRAKRLKKAWEQKGRFGPPHIIKQQMLLDHANRFHTEVLVETGTFQGDMIHAMKKNFKSIYSIELDTELHNRAKSVFKKDPHIHLVAGDSGVALERVLEGIKERCLFWLDGHYSGGVTALGEEESPVRAEIEAILRHPIKDHVVLIDDAICFDGTKGYPTLFELYNTVMGQLKGYEMRVFDNVVQIRPAIQ